MYVSISLCLSMLFILNGLNTASAAIAHQKISNKDANKIPGKCVAQNGLILSPNESGTVPGASCIEATCVSEYYIQYKTCPSVVPPPGCRFDDFINLEAKYPECCQRNIICKQ